MEFAANFWALLAEAAPWLLFGFLIAGLLHAFLPPDLLSKHLGKEGFATTVKAAFIGAPLPLCSCGVIPAALGLRRSGASKSATVSFLVATPETGVDSVSVSYAMLGPIMAVVRPIAAISSAIVAGVLVGKEEKFNAVHSQQSSSSSCCNEKKAEQEKTCCSSEPKESKRRFSTKLLSALQFSTGKLIADTAGWLLIGLFFAAVIKTFVSTDLLASYGQGIFAMSVMVLISIPMYICATASTPIAAGLLFAGVSPGAVLVFMLAGPATNIATLGVVGNELGKRALVAYLIGVVLTAMIFGAGLDYGLSYFNVDFGQSIAQHQHLVPETLSSVAAWVLVILLVRAIFTKLKSKFANTSVNHMFKRSNHS